MATSFHFQGTHGSTELITSAMQMKPSAVLLFLEGDQIRDLSLCEDLGSLVDPRHHLNLMISKCPDFWVGVVMPDRVHGDGFSCYDNMLDSTTETGEPLRYRGDSYKASSHLADILEAVSTQQLHQPGQLSLLGLPCHIVAFSKGGVVLNQLLCEVACYEEALLLAASQDNSVEISAAPSVSSSRAAQFMDSVNHVHYLDAGLQGRGVHVTDVRIIQNLALRGMRASAEASVVDASAVQRLIVHFHGTPRQWCDPRRQWISQEKDRSIALMKEAGVPVTEHLYFQGQRRSARQHFAVIEAMQPTM
ncbi:hypothetical protein CEUSTIGMA_g7157.t1 [Chlamydomonas eustigma]|uniref:Uncharacterized protein n=1 Tax=Chlamydomonas eustigma TaxID=1157962 RepID=A0A250X9J9_9CHLO|nr:hypothetical protein CEUSTIGMA_g7157.t1 [Chlamydomonas eustigma]|eukprot:GAX79716.1 hypothetical protein CEUSTIGMA_g7157.t1 [Chlamydomonas eustigma]